MPLRLVSLIGFLFLALLEGCREETATLMLVTVNGKEGVVSPREAQTRTRLITNLQATFTLGETRVPQVLSNKGNPIELPTDFVIRADGLEGPMQLDLKAMDDHQSLGAGSISAATLVKDQQGEATAVLFPDDFGLNENRAGPQFFSTEAGFARQVASTPDGSFVSVWEDACGTLTPPRCDVWYRLFDRTGTPKLNGLTGKTDEYIANERSDLVYDMPSVAAQDSGGFLIVWQRTIDVATSKVFSRMFTAEGRPDPSSNNGSEVELSGSDVTTGVLCGVPYATALRDGGYLVVWQQTASPGVWEIKARFLGPNGMPAPTSTGSSEPFAIQTFGARPATCGDGTCDAGESCMTCWDDCFDGACAPWPVAAAGANQGFLVVWNEEGMVRGKAFGPRAQPIKPTAFDVDVTKSKKVREVAASPIAVPPMTSGYAVVWSDVVGSGPDTDIRIRRLTLDGDPVQPGEQEYTLNTSTADDQRSPAVAIRPDGSLLVVWATSHPDPDVEGGIRGRLVLPNLLPIGVDFPINTTADGKQDTPAVAARGTDSFVVVFVDASKKYPDQSETGIRGRIVYPEFAPQDGLIGASCDEKHDCGTGLTCQTVDPNLSPRCVARCSTVNQPCSQGGVCSQLSAGDLVCLFK